MKVQVLMSTYNGEKYIKTQLDSILAQDYEEIDLLIRDDGSTDSTREILSAYAKKYSSITWYSGKNIGVQKSFFDLILKAKDVKRTSFVLEFKYLKEDKKALEEALDELSNKAIRQIKENKYDYGLKGKVIYIGLAHHGKNVSVKWENKI